MKMTSAIKQIVNGIAVPVIAINAQFDLLAANELAREAFKLAAAKLPVATTFSRRTIL